MTRICCVCNKIKHQEQWIAVEVPVGREQLSHGYCPACYAEVLADISLFMDQAENLPALPVQVTAASDTIKACA